MIVIGFVVTTVTAAAPRPLIIEGCPIYRATVPGCWTVEYQGETYYIGYYSPGRPPQLKHKMLVEGIAQDEAPRACGGIVIKPINLSALPEVDLSCDSLLPDNGKPAPADSFTLHLPEDGLYLNIYSLVEFKPSKDDPLLSPPYKDVQLRVEFEFDSADISLINQARVLRVFNYAQASHAQKLVVTGYIARIQLSDGSVLVEKPQIAIKRANAVSQVLANLGIPRSLLEIRSQEMPIAAGANAYENRKVTIDFKVPPQS